MGVISRLFRAPEQNDGSYVRSWAEKRERELRYSKELSKENLMENLFAAVIWGLSSFGRKDTRRSIPSKYRGLGLDASEHYSGDASLFELGCYMYFRLDLWLCKHKPHHREHISRTFASGFTKLLTQALNSRDIPALFDQRLSQYAKLLRAGADLKEYHDHLFLLILCTRDNYPPVPYDSKNEPMISLSAFEHFGVGIAVAAWEENMIPGLVKSIENYCALVEQQEITEST